MYFYTSHKQSGNQILKTIPFTIVLKYTKYLEINLTKDAQGPYFKNNKILLRELKKT